MNILIYLAAIVMGITLGIIGGGGSILTVPILTELKGEPANLATAYSLIIVGISALAGAVAYIRKGQVSFRIALLFGAPAVGGDFLVRNLVVPAIPHEIFHIGSFTMTNGMAIMLVFAVIMVLASYTMIKGKNVLLSGGEGTAAAASPPAGTGVEAGDGSTLALKASGLARGCSLAASPASWAQAAVLSSSRHW